MFIKLEIVVNCYVYDFIIVSENNSDIDSVKAHLNRKSHIKDLGRPLQLLWIEVDWTTPNQTALRQSKLIETMLHDKDMANTKPVERLTNIFLTDDDIMRSTSLFNVPRRLLRSIVGSLIYLTVRTELGIFVVASILRAYV